MNLLQIKQWILLEKLSANYFAIIVDSTSDSSHNEETTFILRYVLLKEMRVRKDSSLQIVATKEGK